MMCTSHRPRSGRTKPSVNCGAIAPLSNSSHEAWVKGRPGPDRPTCMSAGRTRDDMSRRKNVRLDVGFSVLPFSTMATRRTRTLIGTAGEPMPVKKVTGPSVGCSSGRTFALT